MNKKIPVKKVDYSKLTYEQIAKAIGDLFYGTESSKRGHIQFWFSTSEERRDFNKAILEDSKKYS